MNLTPIAYIGIALICLLGIVDQWSPADTFTWWRLFVVLFLSGLLYEWLTVRSQRLLVKLTDSNSLRLGRQECFKFALINTYVRALQVRFVPNLPADIVCSNEVRNLRLAGAETTDIALIVTSTKLGAHPWSGLPLRLKGPLGLGWWSRRGVFSEVAMIQVVPELLTNADLSVGSTQSGVAQAVVGSGYELHHLREYVPGDARHTIDWKATARTNRLVTRVYSEDQHLEIMIVIDVGRTSRTQLGGLSQLGHYANLAARFAQYAGAADDRVGLVAIAEEPVAIVPPDRGAASVGRIRKALTGLQTLPVEADLLSAGLKVRQLMKHRSLILVLTDMYGHDAQGRLAQCLALWTPKHLPMVVGLIGDDVKELSVKPAKGWLDPYHWVAAREYSTNLHRTAQGIQRLGAYPIVSRPAELEQKVFSTYRLLKAQRRV